MEDPTSVASPSSSNVAAGIWSDESGRLGTREKVAAVIRRRAGKKVVREYTADCGPADLVLFVDRKPVGVIEAKKETGRRNSDLAESSNGSA